MNSRNTKDVMVTFVPATLKQLDAYCKRTGLKRSTAIMQSIALYLAGTPRGEPVPDLSPQPAPRKTESLVKTKLRRKS